MRIKRFRFLKTGNTFPDIPHLLYILSKARSWDSKFNTLWSIRIPLNSTHILFCIKTYKRKRDGNQYVIIRTGYFLGAWDTLIGRSTESFILCQTFKFEKKAESIINNSSFIIISVAKYEGTYNCSKDRERISCIISLFCSQMATWLLLSTFIS